MLKAHDERHGDWNLVIFAEVGRHGPLLIPGRRWHTQEPPVVIAHLEIHSQMIQPRFTSSQLTEYLGYLEFTTHSQMIQQQSRL